jgi:hypothetical protein
MKQLILNETTKNQVRYFVNDIFGGEIVNRTIYIPFNDDELMLDEIIDDEYFKLDESKKYFKVYFTDISIHPDDVECEMNLDEYKEKHGIMYYTTPEYREDYKSIKDKLFEEKTIPAVVDTINKAIDEYNDLNDNSKNSKREVYDLKNGFMPTCFEDFEYKNNINRICVAKVIKDKVYDWINWVPKKGYNLNNIQRGDVIMVKKMEAFKNRDIDKIFYKVISISKDKLICEYGNGDKVYTTYLKALKG